MRIVRVADQRRMPWKNGGGETIELALSPDGADLGAFDWRVSMATVASDGPFSQFAGVDRSLAVIEGDGIELAIDGAVARVLTMTVGSAPVAFAGDALTSARLLGGAIVDLNAMTRRGTWAHRLRAHDLAARHELGLAAAHTSVVLAATAGVGVRCGAEFSTLARYDAVVADARDRATLVATAACRVYVVELAPG